MARSKVVDSFAEPKDTRQVQEARWDQARTQLRSTKDNESEPREHPERPNAEETCLDPLTRHLANPFGMNASIPNHDPPNGLQQRIELARAQTLEQMLPSLVRKAAWQIDADRRSATLRLEIGSGTFDGATVLIRADLHEVRIELDAPPGIDLEAWKSRLRLRLASQGLIAVIS
jgi:hypothetical protein